MSSTDSRDKAYSLLTEHWGIYEDVGDILDDLLDIGIDEPEADTIIESYKTEMNVKVPIAPKREATNKGTVDDIFLNTGSFPYASRPYMEEAKPPDIEKEKEKLKPSPKPSKGTEGKAPAKFSFKQDDGVVVLGKRGSGKTNLIRYLVNTLKFNFLILDAIRNLEDLENHPNVVGYHQLNPQDTKKVNDIIETALEEGDLSVVVDEVDRYKTTIGTKLNDLVNLGRNYGVGYLAAARRTARIDKDVLAGATWTFVFKHILPQDLEVLVDWFAVDEVTFRELGDYEAILFRNDQEVWRGTVKLVPGAPEQAGKPPEAPEKAPKEPKEPQEPEAEPPEEGAPTPPTGEGREGETAPKAPPEGGEAKDESVIDTDARPPEGRTCPKCGNKNVHWEGGRLKCPRCGYV